MQYDIKKLVVDASVSFSIWQNFKHVTQARNIFRFILYLDKIAFYLQHYHMKSFFHLIICSNYWFRNNTLDVLLNFVHDELKAFILITRIDHKTTRFDLQSFSRGVFRLLSFRYLTTYTLRKQALLPHTLLYKSWISCSWYLYSR